MSPPFLLSVLDQSPIAEGSSGAQALRNTIDLARLCDELGYHRYWVAEHHGGPMLAGPSPEALIGPVGRGITPLAAEAPRTLRSPGLLVSHYAPRLPVRLGAAAADAREALLAFGPAPAGAGCTFQLSAAGDVAEAAARLFAGLRWLDEEGARLGLSGIAAMPVPMEGLGLAINDRLQRAAAPRP